MRRSGAQTRSEIQRVAFELFSTQGYDATSLREIATALGINKASLYYHFASKEEILASLFEQRGSEVTELLEWLREQPASPSLLEETVLRWVDSFSIDKLRGIRFLTANPRLARRTGGDAGEGIGAGLRALADELSPLLPDDTPRRRLLLRMSILSINAAVFAAAETDIPDAEIIGAAHDAARALIEEARSS